MATDEQDFIELETIDENGSSSTPEGPKSTTSMKGRRVPLTKPEKQFEVLSDADVDGGPTGSGWFQKDLEASGWDDLTPA